MAIRDELMKKALVIEEAGIVMQVILVPVGFTEEEIRRLQEHAMRQFCVSLDDTESIVEVDTIEEAKQAVARYATTNELPPPKLVK